MCVFGCHLYYECVFGCQLYYVCVLGCQLYYGCVRLSFVLWVCVRLSVVLPLLSFYLHLIPTSHSALPNKMFTHFISPTYVLHIFPSETLSCNAQQPNIWNGLQTALVNPLDMQSPLYPCHLLSSYGNIIPSLLHSFIHFEETIRNCDSEPCEASSSCE